MRPTQVLDKAADAFSRGFYDALARACTASDANTPGTEVGALSAYDNAARGFEEAGYVHGDPDPSSAVHIKGSHGAFGILLPRHSAVARFTALLRSRSLGRLPADVVPPAAADEGPEEANFAS